jgi:hypothetical protein
MRLAFLIWWRNHYRLLGPVIERALARGWDAECWHAADEAKKSRSQGGAEPLPTFRHGQPRRREYRDEVHLRRLLTEANPDVVLTLRPPDAGIPEGRPRWLGLQYTLDVGRFVDVNGHTRFAAMGVHTEYWRQRAADALRILEFNDARAKGRSPAPVNAQAVEETLRQRGVVVGFPEMDQFHEIDPTDVRRRFGLDPHRPVVVYCPYPFRSNPSTDWVKYVYGNSWGPRRWIVRRRPEYRGDVRRGWNDRNAVRALRAFCDANGATLIVKARDKEHGIGIRRYRRPQIPSYLRRAAHRRVVYDQGSHYPATIVELMSIASLCVHSFSTVAYEAAYAAVPSICVTADGDDLGFPPIWREWFLSAEPGSSFNFPGVTYPLSVAQMVDEFPRRRLADFPLEPAARAHYLEQFVGVDDGKASDRLLDLAASLAAGGGR